MLEELDRAIVSLVETQQQIMRRLQRIEERLNPISATSTSQQKHTSGELGAGSAARKLLYSRKEAAAALGISIRTLDHMIATRLVSTRRLGRKVLIATAELRRVAGQNTYSLPALSVKSKGEHNTED